MEHKIFSAHFLDALRSLINQHHLTYPRIPPQGIFFESLVERAFKNTSIPFERIEPTERNAPRHDLLVGKSRVSVKSETGAGTRRNIIHITKLCTTEKDPWEPGVLVAHVLRHLSRYDLLVSLRAIWNDPVIEYQVIEVPIELLKRIGGVTLREVGKARTRRSLAAEILDDDGERLFRVYFDGTDGKCQIQGLRVDACTTLATWQHHIRD